MAPGPVRPSARVAAWGVLGLAGIAWLLRALPFLRMPDWEVPTDYDDGVYFSAASLLVQGVLPYRDFTLVHPPGILLIHAPLAALGAWIGPAAAFIASRWFTLTFAALGALLAGRVAARAAGPVAGLVAAAVFATHPEAIGQDRGPYLEPALNVLALAMAAVWLSDRARRPRGAVLSGVLAGAACAVKVWGGAWVLAALASLPGDRRRRAALAVVAGACAVGLVVLGPFALAAFDRMVEQTLWFHALRPPDGMWSKNERALWMLLQYPGPNALIVLGVGLLAVRGRLRQALGGDDPFARCARFFGAAFLVLVLAFSRSRGFWLEYCSHLAPCHAVLAGLGAQLLWDEVAAARRRVRPAMAVAVTVAVGVALVGAVMPSTVRTFQLARARHPEEAAVGAFLREHVPSGACVLAFEPIWTLAGDRVPVKRPGLPALVDVYGQMLIAAMRDGARSDDLGALLHSPAAQAEVRRLMEGCQYLVLGGRGHWHLDEASLAWVRERYLRRFPPEGEKGIDVWERR